MCIYHQKNDYLISTTKYFSPDEKELAITMTSLPLYLLFLMILIAIFLQKKVQQID